MNDTEIILTSKQVLYNFGISREVLRRWGEKGLQRVERGKFDLKTIIRFRDEFITGYGHDEMGKAKLRRERAKARFQEILTLEKEGLLIEKRIADQWIRNIILEARAVLLQIPYRLMEVLAVETDPKGIFVILKKEIYAALTILGEGRKRLKRRGIS